MNLIDIAIIIVLIIGAYRGWRYGLFRSLISLVGTVLVFVLAYYLKNPLSTLLYENLPFFNFGGIFSGITSFNILVYEGISYLICVILLSVILKVTIKLTGIVDKLVNLTVIFTLPSKIIGLILGAFEFFIFAFIALFIMAQIPKTSPYVNKSNLGHNILTKTPGISLVTKNIYKSVNEIYNICLNSDDNNKESRDYASLNVLMKYDIISVDSVKKLKESKKIKIENIDKLIEKYEVKK